MQITNTVLASATQLASPDCVEESFRAKAEEERLRQALHHAARGVYPKDAVDIMLCRDVLLAHRDDSAFIVMYTLQKTPAARRAFVESFAV